MEKPKSEEELVLRLCSPTGETVSIRLPPLTPIDDEPFDDPPEEFLDLCDDLMRPEWDYKCGICGASPVVPETGMCGPCTFGEASTVNGNW